MATETSALAGLEPGAFWSHFEALTKIPRPSRHEGPVIEHVRRWAADHGFELVEDSGRNLVIRVPATDGRETAPTVTLQGHLDMVCERDSSSESCSILERVHAEHEELRGLVSALREEAATGDVSGETLARLADLLDANVRREERELFPLLEDTLRDTRRDRNPSGRVTIAAYGSE